MVRELERKRQSAEFPETAPAANPLFFRTYIRRTKAGLRETWNEVCDRTENFSRTSALLATNFGVKVKASLVAARLALKTNLWSYFNG